MKKPINRNKLRILLGTIYYSFKQYYYWYFSTTDFAKSLEGQTLKNEIFTHKTVLRRKLKDVEMWMQENKIENLKIALKKLNGLVIEPGQTFSYWRQIGKPTKRKGYLKGMILHNGRVMSGLGGGLCQLSNLIYWITLHTPLTVTERWRHSYDVFPDVKRNQPFGTGATCAFPNIDLQIKNNTDEKFQLHLEVTDQYLVAKWLSEKPIEFKYEIIEKDHLIQNEWWGGYTRSNKIYRKIFSKKINRQVDEELITENQAIMMYEPLLEHEVSS
jgi:vancomycin resistance protein VanW